MEVFIVFDSESEVIIGVYSSKYKAFKKVFNQWCDDNGVDAGTLKDYDDIYVGDELTFYTYHIYKVELDSTEEFEIDITARETQYSCVLPKEFKDLKILLDKMKRDENIKNVIDE